MKKLIKVVFASVLMLTATSVAMAQDHKQKHNGEKKKEHFQKIEAAKKEYFTKELNLTDKESEKFWTIHNDYKKAKKENGMKSRDFSKKLRSGLDSIPETEIKSISESLVKLQKERIDIEKAYLDKAAEVIGYKRAVKSVHLERQFKRELTKKVGEKRTDTEKGQSHHKKEFKQTPVEK